jgi:EAL domain-containing protein (putative c-di-GMP-specific phosphodiesterase class I)/GGDEF domain-containing protein
MQRTFKKTIWPILVLEILVVLSIFLVGFIQARINRTVVHDAATQSFEKISEQIGSRLVALFDEVRKDVSAISTMTGEILIHPMRYKNDEIMFSYKEGFFLRDEVGVASLYTTNLTTLNDADKMKLQQLSLAENVIDTMVSKRGDFIDSAWVNLGSTHSLYYPKIDVSSELRSDLDPTTQRYYYAVDSEHNPSKESKFVALYTEEWALAIGQLGAMVAPIYIDNEFKGVVGMTLTAQNVKRITDLEMPFNAYMVIVDDDNHLLFSSNEHLSKAELGVDSFYALYKKGIQSNLAKIMPHQIENESRVTFSQKIRGTSLNLILLAKKSEITKEIDDSFMQTRLWSLGIVFVVGFLHLWFYFFMHKKIRRNSERLAKPITEMAMHSNELFIDKELYFGHHNTEEFNTLSSNLSKAHDSLIKQLNFNPITKFPNRRKMNHDLAQNSPKALMLISLDNYRMISNVYGPNIGDGLLVSVGELFDNCSIANNNLYHIYNDVFAVILYQIPQGGIKERFMEFAVHIESSDIVVDSLSISANHSVGVAYESDLADDVALFTKAEIALDIAIKDRHRMFVEFDDELHSKNSFQQNLEWAKKLKDAMNENRLVAYYQPIYDIHNDRVVKFEALVRMVDGDKVISPFFFLPAAEQIGALTDITKIMLRHVFSTAEQFPEIEFSINTSFEDFEHAGILDEVQEMLTHFNINPNKIIFEILETGTFSNIDRATKSIALLKSMGIKIAIDDFGTGNSNFSHLTLMKVDYIKIDGQFIKNILEDTNSQNITQTIKEFARLSGAKTIAEYVENGEILDKIGDYGVDFAQGYYISAPIAKAKIAALLEYKREK